MLQPVRRVVRSSLYRLPDVYASDTAFVCGLALVLLLTGLCVSLLFISLLMAPAAKLVG